MPNRPGTPADKLRLDIKLCLSKDGATTWSAPATLFSGGHRNYLLGLIPLPKNKLYAHWLNFAEDTLQGQIL